LRCEPDCTTFYNQYAEGGYTWFIVKLNVPFTREADLANADAIAQQRKAITAVQDQFKAQYLTTKSHQINILPYGLTPYLVASGGINEITALMTNPLVVLITADSPNSPYYDLGLLSLKSDSKTALVPSEPVKCKPSCSELLKKAAKENISVVVLLRTENPLGETNDPEIKLQQALMIRHAQSKVLANLKGVPGIFGPNLPYFHTIYSGASVTIDVNKQGLEHLLSYEGAWFIAEETNDRAFQSSSVSCPISEDSTGFHICAIGAQNPKSRISNGGVNGSGQVIVFIDTGIAYRHPALLGKVIGAAGRCFSDPARNTCTASTGLSAREQCFVSGCTHGTGVASVATAKLDAPTSTGFCRGDGLPRP
jgi:hypothetical protein